MTLTRYKLCPDCGQRVGTDLMECPDCGYDMSTVPEAGENAERGPQPSPAGTVEELVLVCSECGAVNPVQARKCLRCGEELGDLLPVPRPAETPAAPADGPAPLPRPEAATVYELVSRDGACRLTLTEPETVLGREAALRGYLADKLYVGRRQARLLLDEGKVRLESLGATNPTFLNGEELDPGAPALLAPGDEIGLGGTVIDGERQDLAAYLTLRVKA